MRTMVLELSVPRILLTHRFPLEAYRQALAVAAEKGKYRSIKVAFELQT